MAKRKRKSPEEIRSLLESATVVKDELDAQRKYVASIHAGAGDDLARQREHIKRLGKKAGELGLVDEAKFVESMRDVGYKSTAFALAELIDNAVQAGAHRVDVIAHCDKGQKVSALAVMDDGHGMDPLMILEGVRWGGTHRHSDRSGFGRFGMGMSSASVSQGRRMSVFSKPSDGSLHSVSLDLDEIARDALKNGTGGALPPPDMLEESERSLPKWLVDYRTTHGLPKSFDVGTVVILDKLDRQDFKTKTKTVTSLLLELGMIYRYYLDGIEVFVNGKAVEMVDPLFTLPGHRDPAANDNDLQAEDRGTIRFEVRDPDSGKQQGWVRVRFSYMHPHFARHDKERGVGEDGENGNYRLNIIKSYNKGLQILRRGRVVDWLDSRCPFMVFMNNDRYWGCEIDFDPSLDEEWRVTNSKQQVVPSDRMWKLLDDAGVFTIISQIRSADGKLREKLEKAKPKGEKPRSVQAVEAATADFGDDVAGGLSGEGRKKAGKAASDTAKRKAKAADIALETAEAAVEKEINEKRWAIELRDDLPQGGPFFTAEARLHAESRAVQIAIAINTNHRFYTDVYNPASWDVRDALEVMLFAVGRHMADAQAHGAARGQFYMNEVQKWSTSLENYLYELAQLSARDADAEDSADEVPGDARRAGATATA